MREFLAICLRRAGHEVTVATTGAEAVALVRATPIDVVITDLRMPGELDGLGVLKAIKTGTVSYPATPNAIPSIITPACSTA